MVEKVKTLKAIMCWRIGNWPAIPYLWNRSAKMKKKRWYLSDLPFLWFANISPNYFHSILSQCLIQERTRALVFKLTCQKQPSELGKQIEKRKKENECKAHFETRKQSSTEPCREKRALQLVFHLNFRNIEHKCRARSVQKQILPNRASIKSAWASFVRRWWFGRQSTIVSTWSSPWPQRVSTY